MKLWRIKSSNLIALSLLVLCIAFTKGQEWLDIDAGNVLDIEFHPDSTNMMFLTVGSGGLFKSDDNGESLDTILTDIVAYDLTINYYSPDTMYLACGSTNNNQSGVLKVIHSGGSYVSYWSDNGIDFANDASVRFVRILPGEPAIMFASTSTQLGGNLYSSTDYGRNWSLVELPVQGRVNFLEFDPFNHGTIYCGSSLNVLFKSSDSGQSWTSLDYGATTDWYPTNLDIHPNDGPALYLSSQAEGLFKSSDAGTNWNKLTNLPSNSSTNLVLDPNHSSNLYVISPYGVFMTNDMGVSWEDFSFNLNGFGSPLKNIYIDPTSSYLFATPDYFSTYRLDLSTVSLAGHRESLPNRLSVMCFPNPFNPSTTIDYELPEHSEVSLVIYDVAGREVNTLIAGEQSAGSYTMNWKGTDHSGRQIAGGMYFAKLEAGEYSSVVKMVYLR